MNDTVGTLMAHAYRHPETIMGVILGTGSNTCKYYPSLLTLSVLFCFELTCLFLFSLTHRLLRRHCPNQERLQSRQDTLGRNGGEHGMGGV